MNEPDDATQGEDLPEEGWSLMDQWQAFVMAHEEDAHAGALLALMTDLLLRQKAWREDLTLEDTLLFWYRDFAPTIADTVERVWISRQEKEQQDAVTG